MEGTSGKDLVEVKRYTSVMCQLKNKIEKQLHGTHRGKQNE